MKTLLLHMDGTPRCAARLHLADMLSRRFDAHVNALFAATPPMLDLPYAYAAEAISLEVLQQLHDTWRDRARASFRAAALGERATWSELGVEPVITGFANHARLADLTLLGQHDPADAEHEVPADFVSSVLIDSGRAGLVVPYAGTFDTVGTRVLVAWKAAAASARALAAALPLLRGAEEVTVVSWGPLDSADPLPEVERYLRRAGVAQVRTQRESDEPSDVGERLLSRAADAQADLLVMGCYGHGRAREFVLGGATRTVLRSMTLPVLMSH